MANIQIMYATLSTDFKHASHSFVLYFDSSTFLINSSLKLMKFGSNLSNTRKYVSLVFQTPRSRLRKQGTAECF